MLKGRESSILIFSRGEELWKRLGYYEVNGISPILIEDTTQKLKIYEKVIRHNQLLAKKQGNGG